MNSFTKIFFLFLMVCFYSEVASAQSAAEIFKNANDLYKKNKFDEAASAYEKIIGQGYESPDAFYNLGNCYYKLKRIGKAILYFKKAEKISPGDEDIQHNLQIAELKTIDKIRPLPQLKIFSWWNEFVSSQSSDGWSFLAIFSLWISVIVFTTSMFVFRKKIFSRLSFALILVSVCFFLLAYHQKKNEESDNEAVLMVSNTDVKSAPDANSSNLFIIHEGTCFKIFDSVGNWNKIKLEDGKVGWIESNSYLKI